MKIRFRADNINPEADFLKRYDNIYDSKDTNLKIVSKDNLWGVVDKEGNEVIPLIYRDLDDFEGNYIVAESMDKNFGLIDKNNNIFMPFEYTNIISAKEIFLGSKVNESSNLLITLFSNNFNITVTTNLNSIRRIKNVLTVNILNHEILKINFFESSKEIYFLKDENNLKLLTCQLDKNIFYEPEKISITADPGAGDFKIVENLYGFLQVIFERSWTNEKFERAKYWSNFGALCKIENNQIVCIIPFSQDDKRSINTSDHVHPYSNNFTIIPNTALSNLSKSGPIKVSVSDKIFIRAFLFDKVGLFNLDGTVFIPQKYANLYELYENNSIILGFISTKVPDRYHESFEYELININTGLKVEESSLKDSEKFKNLVPSTRLENIFFETNEQRPERMENFYLTKSNGERLFDFTFKCVRYFSKKGETYLIGYSDTTHFMYTLNKKGRLLKQFKADTLYYCAENSIYSVYPNRKIELERGKGVIKLQLGKFFTGDRDTSGYDASVINLQDSAVFGASLENKVGMLDYDFNVTVPFEYDSLSYSPAPTHNKYVIVKKYDSIHVDRINDEDQTLVLTGAYGVVSIKNEPVLPFIFDSITPIGMYRTIKLFKGRIGKEEIEIGQKTVYKSGSKMYEQILTSPNQFFKNLLSSNHIRYTGVGVPPDELNPEINESLVENKYESWLKDLTEGNEYYKKRKKEEKIERKLKRIEEERRLMAPEPGAGAETTKLEEAPVPEEVLEETPVPEEAPVPEETTALENEPTSQTYSVRLNRPLLGTDGTQYQPGEERRISGIGTTDEERRADILRQLHNLYPETTDDWFTVL